MSLPIDDIAIRPSQVGWAFSVTAMGARYRGDFRSLDELRLVTVECVTYFTNSMALTRRTQPPTPVVENGDANFKIHRISIKPLLVLLNHRKSWHLEAEIGAMKFDMQFADFAGYLLAFTEMMKVVAVRAGTLRTTDAGITRDVVAGRIDGMVLPGDKKH